MDSMKKTLKTILTTARRYPYSTLCIVVVWALSLTPFFPEVPLTNVAFADKWTHFIMYGGTAGVVWLEYWHRHRGVDYTRLWLWAGIGLSLMGGLLELMQAYCTTTRSGEWLDFVADSVGAIGASAIGTLLALLVLRR